MNAAIEDDDRDLDEFEAEEFDGLADEVKDLRRVKLARLKALDASAVTAKAVRADDCRRRLRARAAPCRRGQGAASRRASGFARYGDVLRQARRQPAATLWRSPSSGIRRTAAAFSSC